MSSAVAAADKQAGPIGLADPGFGEAIIRTHFAARFKDQATCSAGGSGKYPAGGSASQRNSWKAA